MTPEERIALMSDIELLALCIWREARGEGHAGMRAVANTIRNRVKRPRWWGKDWRSVILHPWQYSCFNGPDENGKGADPQWAKFSEANDVRWADALNIAHEIIHGLDLADPTSGATHYFVTKMPNPPAWRKSPAMQFTCEIGAHSFFLEA